MKKIVYVTMTILLISSVSLSACQTAQAPGDAPETMLPVAQSESDNVRIFSPAPETVVVSPLVVKGEARVFENQFNYRLLDEDGSVLAEGSGYADAPDMGQYGPFELTIGFANAKGKTGTLEVFDYSAENGLKADIATLPIKFAE